MSTREIFSCDQPRSTRSFAGVTVSVVLHVMFGLAIYVAGAYLNGVATPAAFQPAARRLTFVNIAVPPEMVVKPLRLKAPVIPREAPRPAPKVELHRAEIQPPVSQPLPREVAPAPKTVVEQIRVGSFSAPAAQVRAPEPSRLVQSTDFDSPSSKALSPELKMGSAVVGAFQNAAAAGPRSTADRPTVTSAGFGEVGLAQKEPSRARTLGDAGFGDAKHGERTQTPSRVAQVQPAFANLDAPQRPTRRPTPAPERVEMPVEIILKPTPEYTSEARAQKIEGEVLLEVEFRASGEARVLRVVRGLGHGLDESAARAAERIQFKPARTSKGPVDSRATIQIVFRLT